MKIFTFQLFPNCIFTNKARIQKASYISGYEVPHYHPSDMGTDCLDLRKNLGKGGDSLWEKRAPSSPQLDGDQQPSSPLLHLGCPVHL